MFNKDMFMLEEMMKDIKIKNNLEIPIVPESVEILIDNQYKHTFALSEVYKVMNNYFEERNLPNFYLMLNEYDDRCSFSQNYQRKELYKRKFFIGPIMGIKYIYKRKKKTVKYCLFDYFKIVPKCKKERVINDFTEVTDEKNRIPITIYR